MNPAGPAYRICVPLRAAPQGSKRHVGNGIMVESSQRLKGFRTMVTLVASEASNKPAISIAGPVVLRFTTFISRPKAHYWIRKSGTVLKDGAPRYPISHNCGDVSKLQRAIEDALTDANWWQDDAQVIRCEPISPYRSMKEYIERGDAEHTIIEVSAA